MDVILVDRNDKRIGKEEKIRAHQKGRLHRAFSILVFNSKGETMLQRRALSKYHSPGLWTNTCCSHPRLSYNLKKQAEKRLKEEMGISCPLKEVFTFKYKAKLGNLIEHEFDHVFMGKFEGRANPNKKEVDDWKWISLPELKKDMKKNPQKYTPWFKIILDRI
ncbi:MAG: isopentenyl-diphosphate Delta-isomerase [Candidatus Nealsonbacteria bacterium]|nr:isopentenyl-diphosphate Delta-isomerase [Candidatus Nealsonbacteria bacterium]